MAASSSLMKLSHLLQKPAAANFNSPRMMISASNSLNVHLPLRPLPPAAAAMLHLRTSGRRLITAMAKPPAAAGDDDAKPPSAPAADLPPKLALALSLFKKGSLLVFSLFVTLSMELYAAVIVKDVCEMFPELSFITFPLGVMKRNKLIALINAASLLKVTLGNTNTWRSMYFVFLIFSLGMLIRLFTLWKKGSEEWVIVVNAVYQVLVSFLKKAALWKWSK